MATLQVILHTETDGSLPKAALETLGAAVALKDDLGAEILVGLIGQDVQAAADQIAGCGATAFHGVSGDAFGQSRYATDAAALTALVEAGGAEIILAPATQRFSRAIPGAAARVGGKIDSHISGFSVADGKLSIQRWYYRQRMIATLSRSARPWFLLLDGGLSSAWAGDGGSATVTPVDVTLTDNALRTTVKGVETPSADSQTIRPDAPLLFVAGAGWTKKQSDGQPHISAAGELIQGFLGCADASLGSSKSLVDLQSEGQETLSFMSHLNQVGQTGSTPRHPKGLATCCHGEEPHVVGWRFVNERRAVNLDANCGWAQGKADVLYVADAFEVMQKVNALLGH